MRASIVFLSLAAAFSTLPGCRLLTQTVACENDRDCDDGEQCLEQVCVNPCLDPKADGCDFDGDGVNNEVDDDLTDPIPVPGGEGRNEPVQLAVHADVAEHLGPVALEAAIDVVKRHAREPAHHPVEHPRREDLVPGIAPDPLVAADDVQTAVEGLEKPRNLPGVVLQVGVEREHHVALRPLEARRERRALAEVAPQLDEPHLARVPGGQVRNPLRAAVA